MRRWRRRAHHEQLGLAAMDASGSSTAVGRLSLSGGCISVTVEAEKVCLNLPLGYEKYCFPISVKFSNGTTAEARINIFTTWDIPTGPIFQE